MISNFRRLIRNMRELREAGILKVCRGCKQHYYAHQKSDHKNCIKDNS